MLYVIYQLKIEIFCLYETVSLFENENMLGMNMQLILPYTLTLYMIQWIMN